MHRKIVAAATVGAVGLLLTGCAFGDYMAYAPCEEYAQQVVEVIEDTLNEEAVIGEIWADGAGAPLCRFPVTTEAALEPGDPQLAQLESALETLVDGWTDEVHLTVKYGSEGEMRFQSVSDWEAY